MSVSEFHSEVHEAQASMEKARGEHLQMEKREHRSTANSPHPRGRDSGIRTMLFHLRFSRNQACCEKEVIISSKHVASSQIEKLFASPAGSLLSRVQML